MVVGRVCGVVWVFLSTLSIACGDNGETQSPAGTGASSGGASSGGSNGSAGSAGGSQTACEPDTVSTSSCDEEEALCVLADRCCVCISFTEPSCGLQWSCAEPADNGPDCPADPPAEDSACPADNITCRYCTPTGPSFWRCNNSSAGSSEFVWGESAGLNCAS